jgi:multicomponent Na+:H+ antiporter subunit F
MIAAYECVGLILFGVMILVSYRVVKGPTVGDRMVAVNMIGTKTTVLLLIIGVIFGRLDMFIDFALTYSLLNFLGTLAASRYLVRYKGDNDPLTLKGGDVT